MVCFRHFFQTNQLSFYYEHKQNKPNIKPIREGKRFGFCFINSENKPNFSYMEENVLTKKKPPGCPPWKRSLQQHVEDKVRMKSRKVNKRKSKLGMAFHLFQKSHTQNQLCLFNSGIFGVLNNWLALYFSQTIMVPTLYMSLSIGRSILCGLDFTAILCLSQFQLGTSPLRATPGD